VLDVDSSSFSNNLIPLEFKDLFENMSTFEIVESK